MGETAASAAARAIASERRRTRRGIAPPNIGAFRNVALPSVMASPPTKTLGASGATQIAGYTSGYALHQMTEGCFRYFGGIAALGGSGSPNNQFYVGSFETAPIPLTNLSVDFMIDGAAFEVYTKGNNGACRMWVDGEWVDAAPVVPVGSTGLRYYWRIAFGGRAVRHIRMDFSENFFFGGVAIEPDASIWRAYTDLGPRLLVFGDSFTEGTGAVAGSQGFPFRLGWHLGIQDVIPSGVGGTGYLNPATGGKVKARDRIADVTSHAPEIVLLAFGLNDTNYNPGSGVVTASQIAAEFVLCCQAIKAALPSVTLLAMGPWIGSSNQQSMRDANTAMQAAAKGAGVDCFIDIFSASTATAWLTGTGTAAVPTGNGNADYYRTSGSDVHPTQAGHDYYGHRLAASLVAWIEAGAPKGATVSLGVVTP